jgi:FKBP-type peptidyl-prolyl cis-trans isomerase
MKWSGKVFLFVFLFALYQLAGCNMTDNDFEMDASGLKYKYLEQSESIDIINTGDYVEMELKYWNNADSLLFNSKELNAPFRMQVKKISHRGGSFENALLLLHPGDKVNFVITADSFYFKTLRQELPSGVKNATELFFELKLLKKLQADELEKEREVYISQLKEKETELITNFLHDNVIKTKPSSSGLYFIRLKDGSGRNARSGSMLTVHYTGRFIDGTTFDSSYGRNEPFDFELGALQVIDGWEEAFRQMKEGDKVKLIVPSALAYGKEGYGELIPPYSPLIFEIELIAVN